VKDRVAVVTGASSGIGAAAARELARRGANVVPVGRNPKRLAAVSAELRSENPSFDAEGAAIQADFASLAEVRRLASELLEQHPRIDVLVNNAGLVAGSRALTEDGYETTFAVNHLAPFLLTNLLLDRLRESAPSRVVTTSSDAHRGGEIDFDDLQGERRWSAWSAYSRSKLANVLFTRALARRLEGAGVTANSLHPGVIRTRLGRRTPLPVRLGWRAVSIFFKSPHTGAATIVYLASAPEGGEVSGRYFVDSREGRPSRQALDDALAERLWSESAGMVGL
jgi:NAD(P)-dependent dehydrogenase (short-subunit alcohol dehydrogenase family)